MLFEVFPNHDKKGGSMATKEDMHLVMLGKKLRHELTLQERLNFVEEHKNRLGTTPVSLALIEILALWNDAPLRYQIEK